MLALSISPEDVGMVLKTLRNSFVCAMSCIGTMLVINLPPISVDVKTQRPKIVKYVMLYKQIRACFACGKAEWA